MAIDTEAKRRGKAPPVYVLPLADGTIAKADRQHKAQKYPGILASAPGGFEPAWAKFATQIAGVQSGA